MSTITWKNVKINFTHNIELVMRILVFLLIIMVWNLRISSQEQ